MQAWELAGLIWSDVSRQMGQDASLDPVSGYCVASRQVVIAVQLQVGVAACAVLLGCLCPILATQDGSVLVAADVQSRDADAASPLLLRPAVVGVAREDAADH